MHEDGGKLNEHRTPANAIQCDACSFYGFASGQQSHNCPFIVRLLMFLNILCTICGLVARAVAVWHVHMAWHNCHGRVIRAIERVYTIIMFDCFHLCHHHHHHRCVNNNISMAVVSGRAIVYSGQWARKSFAMPKHTELIGAEGHDYGNAVNKWTVIQMYIVRFAHFTVHRRRLRAVLHSFYSTSFFSHLCMMFDCIGNRRWQRKLACCFQKVHLMCMLFLVLFTRQRSTWKMYHGFWGSADTTNKW